MSTAVDDLFDPARDFLHASNELGLDMTGGAFPPDLEMGVAESEVLPHQAPEQPAIEDEDEQMEDLFGDGEPKPKAGGSRLSSPTPSMTGSGSGRDGLSPSERQRRKDLEYGEEEAPGAEPEIVQQREATVPIPKLPLPQSSDGNHWVIRMPNFVKLEPSPFNPETYQGPEAEMDDAEQAETIRERSMSIKLEVENSVRWRWVTGEGGEKKRQSNSRIVRWSDGSMSLQLGKELFDVSVNVDNSASIPRAGGQQGAMPSASQSSQGISHEAPSAGTSPSQRPQGLSYLVAQHKSSAILQVETPITGYLSLRPTGMASETHRKLVRAVGQKHNKVARLRMGPEVTRDPERENAELLKTLNKKRAKKLKEADGSGGGIKKKRSSFGGRNRMSRGEVYSDDEDEEEEEHRRRAMDSGDEEEMISSSRKRREREAGKRRDPGDYETDDFVVEDDSDNEDDGGRKKKGRRADDDDEEEDEEPADALEEMEQKIEQQRRREKRKEEMQNPGDDGRGGGGGSDEDMDMSDSDAGGVDAAPAPTPSKATGHPGEEEEDGPVTRKAGGSSGRKKVIIEDDDDEE